MRKRTSKMESTRKIVKDSVFFFPVNAGGQRRKSTPVPVVNAGGQRADVALARGGRVGTRGGRVARGARGSVARVRRVGSWHAERVRACGSAWGRVGTRGARGGALPDLWRRVAACGRVSGEPETSGGACEVRSGRFWSQWTDRDEIYPMKVVLRQTETLR